MTTPDDKSHPKTPEKASDPYKWARRMGALGVLASAGVVMNGKINKPKIDENPRGAMVQANVSDQPEYLELLREFTKKGPHYALTEEALNQHIAPYTGPAALRYAQRNSERFLDAGQLDAPSPQEVDDRLQKVAGNFARFWTKDIVQNILRDPEHPVNVDIKGQVQAIQGDIPAALKKLVPLVEKEALLWSRFEQAGLREALPEQERRELEDEVRQRAVQKFEAMLTSQVPLGNFRTIQGELDHIVKPPRDMIESLPGHNADGVKKYNAAVGEYNAFVEEYKQAVRPYVVALQPQSLEQQFNRHATELLNARANNKGRVQEP